MKDYAAEMERKFQETAGSSPCEAVIAPKAAESEAVASSKAVSSPESIIISDSDDPEVSLSAWEPRKKRIKKEIKPDGTLLNGTTKLASSTSRLSLRVPDGLRIKKETKPDGTPLNGETTPASRAATVSAKEGNGATRSTGRDAPTVSSAGVANTSRHQSSTSSVAKDEDSGKSSHPPKRPAEADQNDGRPSTAKKARESSSASLSPALPTRRTGANREPPAWYKQLPKPKGDRARNQSDAEVAILRLKTSINRVKLAQNSALALVKEVDEIAERLHTLIFLPVDGKLLRQTRMLDNNDGLPPLFDSAFTNNIDWPFYLKADAEELYNKWYTGEFETDLYRGITRGLPTKKGKGKGKADTSVADRLAEDYQRFRLMDPKQHGNGLLLNGAWFPSQLVALRDGGHGSSQGGITGNPTSGAYSVIMAGGVDPSGQPYPNEDGGSVVLYCGTDNKDKNLNQPSPDTASLLTNHRTKQPVRLFRSHNLDSQFTPELGFRYDGLYDVASYEDMDPPDNKRRRHRFKLVRRAGQDPIRSQGAAKRPTKQEVDEYEKDKKNRGR
ncbi:hypothetical protein Q7P36_004735 [Cladosporium allicinum]